MVVNLPGLGAPRPDAAAAAQVRSWVRDVLAPDDERSVVVTELACSEPGCPPVETVIGLLAPGNQTQHKIHKPLAEVVADDVLRALRDEDHR